MVPTHIVVVESGWVFIGSRSTENGILTLKDASCIRRWGTSAGLGELAICGKTSDTILDPCGIVEIPVTALLFSIVVDPTKWGG